MVIYLTKSIIILLDNGDVTAPNIKIAKKRAKKYIKELAIETGTKELLSIVLSVKKEV